MPLSNPLAWLLTASFGFMALVFYAMTAWLVPIVRDMGYDRAFAATAFTVFAFIQIPTSLLMPVLLKRWPGRLGWLLAMAAFELVGLAMLATGTAPIAAAAIVGIGTGGLFPLNLLLPMDVTTDGHEAAAWSAMAQSIGYVVGATGPVLLGWVHDGSGGFRSPLVVVMGVVALMIGVQLAIGAQLRRATRAARAERA
jgi:CP family cyanate transporter-like MFS transporter